ncbi:MAG: SGNH/GDSL hydrolase family protein [Verrucomicrobiota bacterium]
MKSPVWFPAFILISLTSSVIAESKPSVLYLGDSLSIGAFGQSFDSSMRKSGFEVHTVVAGGASPYYWLRSYQALPCTIGYWEKSPSSERRMGYIRAVTKLEDLIDDHEPDIVVVQTGINLYATLRSRRRSKEDNVAEVTSLVEQMCYSISKGGAVSYWVLPPHSHEMRYPRELQDELAGIMTSVVERYEGIVFDSQSVTQFVDPYPATDGIHYGPTEARGWAEKVSLHFTNSLGSLEEEGVQVVSAVPVQPILVEGAEREKVRTLGSNVEPLARPGSDADVGNQLAEVELELRLVAKSEIQHLSELDYSHALGVFEYEVVRDMSGNYPHDRIRVAHGIVFNRRFTAAASREIGSSIALRLVPLSSYRTLATWQVKDDLRTDLSMPLYTPKLD